MMTRIGYSAWGHLGNRLHDLDSPSGIAIFVPDLLRRMMEKGYEVWWMQPDQDAFGVKHHGLDYFSGYNTKNRLDAWLRLEHNFPPEDAVKTRRWQLSKHHYSALLDTAAWPELDLLILEWRWPMPHRNTHSIIDSGPLEPDYHLQMAMIEHYQGKCPIYVWDLDDKSRSHDTSFADRLFMPALNPSPGYESLFMPFLHSTVDATRLATRLDYSNTISPHRVLVYIGSDYEREDHIEEWIVPLARRNEIFNRVHFYGNWRKYPEKLERFQRCWPGIVFHDRVHQGQFAEVYHDALAVPILAKPSYRELGFITNRFMEAIMFGSLPVGFHDFAQISTVLPEEYVVNSREGFEELLRKMMTHHKDCRSSVILEVQSLLMETLNMQKAMNTLGLL